MLNPRRFARGLAMLTAVAALAALPAALGGCKSDEASKDKSAAADTKSGATAGACCSKCGTGCACGGKAACCKTS